MFSTKKNIANWGNYPRQDATVFEPNSQAQLLEFVESKQAFTSRGAGKCYGDAALGLVVLSTRKLAKILDFDEKKGIINAESGVLLEDVLRLVVPKGWFFHVTPGIKSITLGGAIASDVHGKNHYKKGCFSNFLLDFDIVLADGKPVFCSKLENTDLFWQTCGAMGWSGLITRVRFQLMPIVSSFMEKETVRCSNLSAVFTALEDKSSDYAAAWLDMTHPKVRGALFLARHCAEMQASEKGVLTYLERSKLNIPFYFPKFTLNRISMALYSALFYRKNKNSSAIVTMDAYFYPLDSIVHWNRLYGRRGFIQYQCLIPPKQAEKIILNMQKIIAKTQHRPFLSVLKKHSARPKEAINSFPDLGFSLAMDFKRKQGIEDLVKDLDALIWEVGGKIYLAKDALSAGKMARINAQQFDSERFTSLQRKRIFEVV